MSYLWPRHRTMRLIVLHGEQPPLRYHIIAERLGMSKDAVCGKCKRLGLARRKGYKRRTDAEAAAVQGCSGVSPVSALPPDG